MFSYAFFIWVFFSPILILIRKPAMSACLKSCLLILPIVGGAFFSTADRLIFRNDDIETALLLFFYGFGLVVTYIAWWELAWRCYYKQWPKNIFGEYFVSNVVLLIAMWPTFIVGVFLLGAVLKLLFDQVIFVMLAIILLRGTGEMISNIIGYLICFLNFNC